MYLVNMDEHHKSIAFTWGILFLLKKGMNQLWGIRDQEIKVSKNKTSKNVSSSNGVKKKYLQGMSLLAHETLLFLVKVYELKINIQNRQEPHVNEPCILKCTAAQTQVCLSIDSVYVG